MSRKYRSRRWVSRSPDPAACLALTQALSISPVVAQVLYNRGLTTPAAAEQFLAGDRSSLHSPHLLTGMGRAVAILRERAASGGRILVWGDYDVDGVTGTAILVSVLGRMGAQVAYHIPNRFTDGYGLNGAGLEKWAGLGYDLVVTVDTGISAIGEAEQARALGLTLIITDHHEPGPQLPDAAAVINPKRPDSHYPFAGLSGAAVAFKLAQALLEDDPVVWEYLDVVALATVADLVPLVGENRILVKEGLEWLARSRRPGLAALKQVAGFSPGPVTVTQIAYQLCPRINALGRMGEAYIGVELFLTADPDRAALLAQQLDAENRSRQSVQAEIVQEAMAQLEQQPLADRSYAVVVAGEGWHLGVVGIGAAKVVEAVYRPTVLLTIEDGEARGSARSIPGFHLFRALEACADLLIKYGGHAMAAGLTLRAADIPAFRARLNALAREWLRDADLVPRLELDAWVAPEQLGLPLAEDLARLEPYGLGNPEPCLGCAGLRVQAVRSVGKAGDHLQLRLSGSNGSHDAIGFGLAQPGAPGDQLLAPGSPCQVAFRPQINLWNGLTRFQLVLEDLIPGPAAPEVALVGPANADTEAMLLAWDPLGGLAEEPTVVRPPTFAPLPTAFAAGVAAADWAEVVAGMAPAQPVLLLVSSPWVAGAARERVERSLRHSGGGSVWVQPWGEPVPEACKVAVALHPPFHLGQVAALSRQVPCLYGAWRQEDWDLAELVLGWPYPDRQQLIRVWNLLRASDGPFTARAIAAGLAGSGLEPVGPWNHLRVRAALQIFGQIGLIGGTDSELLHILPASAQGRGKMNLNGSFRYQTGVTGRAALRRCRNALETPALPRTEPAQGVG